MKEDSNVVNVLVAWQRSVDMQCKNCLNMRSGIPGNWRQKCIAAEVYFLLEKYTFYQHTLPALYIFQDFWTTFVMST